MAKIQWTGGWDKWIRKERVESNEYPQITPNERHLKVDIR
ncbi:uncharacterized protein G2W53_024683 [Senna tora]|uniref:Uncharacterized protein n=1 Tax=Senna tora TaxID=362788 RepID=A0A834WFQ2_9FABA|nr:uncharacterized protein G2W53_024683 [Senna tora]